MKVRKGPQTYIIQTTRGVCLPVTPAARRPAEGGLLVASGSPASFSTLMILCCAEQKCTQKI